MSEHAAKTTTDEFVTCWCRHFDSAHEWDAARDYREQTCAGCEVNRRVVLSHHTPKEGQVILRVKQHWPEEKDRGLVNVIPGDSFVVYIEGLKFMTIMAEEEPRAREADNAAAPKGKTRRISIPSRRSSRRSD